jgi:hypothetical protein
LGGRPSPPPARDPRRTSGQGPSLSPPERCSDRRRARVDETELFATHGIGQKRLRLA